MSSPTGATPIAWRRPARLPPFALIGLYVALALTPLGLAALQGLPPRSFVRELSGGLALVGFAILLVQFVLSGRFRSVSGRTGIDITMRFHQLAALSALLFLVAHPLLYAVPRLYPDPIAALAALSRMFSSVGLRTGVIAWVLLLLLVPMAWFRDRLPMRYELWRLSHGIGAAAIALLAVHHTLSVGKYSGGSPWLAAFWLVLSAIALASLAWVYMLHPLLQQRSPWRVTGNRRVADRMWEVTVQRDGGPSLAFLPGQFVWLNLGHSAFSLTEHPFSISSAATEQDRLAFTIKESGDFTNRIGMVPVGTRAWLDGPHGNFTFAGREAQGIVFLAGGVGFAPVMGMLRTLRDMHYNWPVRLIYGNRVENQILYREEIAALGDVLDFRVDHVLSDPPPGWPGKVGQLDSDVLNDCLADSDPATWLYFVCGPTAMMDGVEKTLLARGVSAQRIISERFKYE